MGLEITPELLRLMYAPLPVGVVVADSGGNLMYANPRAVELLGQSPSPGLGSALQPSTLGLCRTDGSIVPPDELPWNRALALTTEIPLAEMLIARTDGRAIRANVCACPIRDDRGDIAAAIALFEDISLLKHSGRALIESVEFFRSVLESSPGVVYRRDLKRDRYDYVSPAVERMLGIPLEEAARTGFVDIARRIHPDDREKVERVMRDTDAYARQTGCASVNAEFRFRKEGRYIWLSDKFSVILDAMGEPAHHMGFVHDVTDRKLAEEALQKSSERFRLLAALAGGLLRTTEPHTALKDLCGRIMEHLECCIFVNFLAHGSTRKIRLNAWAGFTDEEARSLEYIDYGAGVSGTVARDGVAVIAERIPERCDARAQWLKDRGIRAYACYPLLEAGGKVIGTLGFGTDRRDTFADDELLLMKAVTDEVAVAIVRNRSLEALRGSEERFRNLAENLPDIITRLDKRLRYVYVNPAVQKLVGMPSSYFLGKTAQELGLPRVFCATWDANLRRVFAGKKPCGFEFGFCDEHKRERYYHCILAPEFNAAGEVETVISLSRDITASKRIEEVLRSDKQTLERLVNKRTQELITARMGMEKAKRLADIGTLAATVAHELRNPLAAIAMAGANIRHKSKNAALAGHLNTIEKKVHESDQIINNLLFYSRLKLPNRMPVNISEVLAESVKAVAARLADRAITVSLRVEAVKATVIMADALQLKEVFNNIINNAADAIPASVKGTISVTAVVEMRKLLIAFRDNGIGMSAEVRQKAFDPFFTTKSKGTGLGLSVCWQIIKLHKGSIRLVSAEGKGTTAAIKLPLPRRLFIPKRGQQV